MSSHAAGARPRPDLDPIEWAVLGVIIAGSSLALSIQTKFEQHRKARSEELQRKAVAGNLVRLANMGDALHGLRQAMELIHKVGRIAFDKEKHGIDSASLVFDDDASAEEYNALFDRALYLIGRLNRLVMELDPEGLPLGDDDRKAFFGKPVAEIRERTLAAIHPDNDPYQRLSEAGLVLEIFERLLGDLGAALETGNRAAPA
ncbi:MAG TPA: hypothetical protein VMH86_10610 [Rhizomicrobium sp.]|nr:hypothetical protein [Rhizomicrobium sp.]